MADAGNLADLQALRTKIEKFIDNEDKSCQQLSKILDNMLGKGQKRQRLNDRDVWEQVRNLGKTVAET